MITSKFSSVIRSINHYSNDGYCRNFNKRIQNNQKSLYGNFFQAEHLLQNNFIKKK